MKPNRRTTKELNLRMTPPIHAKLVRLAAADYRSLNAYLSSLIEKQPEPK